MTALLFVDGIILTMWTVVDPLQFKRVVSVSDVYGQPLESSGRCSSRKGLSFYFLTPVVLVHLGLLVYGCWLSYIARKLKSEYQEGKFIAISLLSSFEVMMV